jgi:TPR repeat protein
VKRILILLVALACTLPVEVVKAAESVKPAPAAVPAGFIADDSKLPEGAVVKAEEPVKPAATVATGSFPEALKWREGAIREPEAKLHFFRGEYSKAADLGYAPGQFQLGLRHANGTGVAKDSVEAVKWYRKAAEQDYAPAQCNLGVMYANGNGVVKDSNVAVEWYRRAAEHGNADAQVNLAFAFTNGDGVVKDSVEAVKWLRKAAEQGHPNAQINLGLKYDKGEGVTKDCAEAVKWLRKAAEQGHPVAQNNLGVKYDIGEGVTKDSAEAVKWYRKAAEQGYDVAQNNLGFNYGRGKGVTKDSLEEIKWYRKAAEQGNVQAQFNLGVVYDNGDSVAKDSVEALKWYRKAAEQGHPEAQYRLGSKYLLGEGTAKDSVEAVKWYRKSAEEGNANGQTLLGSMYHYGDGVAKDSIEAVKWYRKAAEQGYSSAQDSLGFMYAKGEGVIKDTVEALAWFNIAAISGDKRNVQNRDIAEGEVGPQGTLQAQQRSKEIQKLIEVKKSGAAEVKPGIGENPATISAKPKANGSGTLVTQNGYILTAAHVVSEAAKITVVTANGEKTARVIRVDDANDLAVLKIEGSSYSALPVAPSRGIKLGQNVATIGFPNVTIQGFSPKLTRGEISSLNGLGDDPRSWQISAPVQPGNSGGPLLDEYGNLIGVIVSKLGMKAAKEIGDIPQNVNYAVKSAYAAALLDSYLGDNAPEPKKAGSKKNFEEMVSEAQKAVVLILVY